MPSLNASIVLSAPEVAGTLALPAAIQGALNLQAPEVAGAISRQMTVAAACVLPPLNAAALLRLRRRCRVGTSWGVGQQRGLSRSLVWHGPQQRGRLRVAWSVPLVVAMGVLWSSPFQIARAAMWSFRAARGWRSFWRAAIPRRLGWSTEYGLARRILGLRIAYASTAQIRAHLGVRYELPAPARRTLPSTWAASVTCRAASVASWAGPARARAVLTGQWLLAAAARRRMSACYAFTMPARVASSTAWAAPEHDRALRAATCSWSIVEPSCAHVPVPPVRLRVAGRDVHVFRLSLSQSSDDGIWHMSATVDGRVPLLAGSAVEVALAEQVWRLVLRSVTRPRSEPAALEATIEAASGSGPEIAIQDLEDARRGAHRGLASSICAALLHVPLAWSVGRDTFIEPPTSHAELWPQPPWQAAASLCRQLGAVLRMAPGGDGAVAVRVGAHDHGVRQVIEADWRSTVAPSPAPAPLQRADQVTVVHQDDVSAIVHVRLSPERAVRIRPLYGCTVDAVEVAEEQLDQEVTLQDGLGAVQAPILRVTAADVWPPARLYWRRGATDVWLAEPAAAIARVRYASRLLVVRVSRSEAAAEGLIAIED